MIWNVLSCVHPVLDPSNFWVGTGPSNKGLLNGTQSPSPYKRNSPHSVFITANWGLRRVGEAARRRGEHACARMS
ncbi:hypothetical protein J6590_043078 [Homalodisca vitripennis]|nr:hypothetical protein J6590_043078 [Homalodisca vitripennis]